MRGIKKQKADRQKSEHLFNIRRRHSGISRFSKKTFSILCENTGFKPPKQFRSKSNPRTIRQFDSRETGNMSKKSDPSSRIAT